jgi:hypothetical protein
MEDSIEQILLAKKIIRHLSMSLHDHKGDVSVGTVITAISFRLGLLAGAHKEQQTTFWFKVKKDAAV